ncbi:DNA polymerase III subunit gamma/tau [Candidatus Poriferisodalis sp.]|uniref:DNA polymerase III subunit gamma/tau n=1 Tax=Candidatus Poriferisodalis sp. TaxID=3101277 RepID=UPI003B018B72
MQHQSLYRRFRPQRFAEVVGQPHLVRALRNAVAEDRVGHAYLLSGPRGTGKTSSARILAKALNCDALGKDGEPCDECERCRSVTAGKSMDLIELDAASNNSVNHIRDMTEKAALVSAGRRKVYLLDEVHMLSAAASNALLKTLEEPPSHVVFILATTDPQKVLPTIRSRTQQFELALVGADEMAAHVRAVAEAADAPVDERIVDYVVERGNGSVRDALSALDTVLAAGGIPDERADVDVLVRVLAAGDLAATLIAVADAASAGVDSRDLAERTARRLRDMFLVGAGVDPAELSPDDITSARDLADTMGRRANVRALEALGAALAQMPQSADRRLTLEAALVGLLADEVLGAHAPPAAARGPSGRSAPDAAGPAAARAAMAATKAPPSMESTPRTAPQSSRPAPPPPPPSASQSPAAPVPPSSLPAAATDEAHSQQTAESAPPAPSPQAAAQPGARVESAPVSGPSMTAEDLQRVWETQIVEQLRPVAAGVFRGAAILAHERNVVTVRLSEGVPLAQARRRANEVQPILSALLDQEARLEVSEAEAESDQIPEGSGGVPFSPPGTAAGTVAPAAAADEAGVAARSPEEGSVDPPSGAPVASAAAGSPARQSASPPSREPDASVSSHEAKVQRIVDRFPGSTVVRVDEGTT